MVGDRAGISSSIPSAGKLEAKNLENIEGGLRFCIHCLGLIGGMNDEHSREGVI